MAVTNSVAQPTAFVGTGMHGKSMSALAAPLYNLYRLLQTLFSTHAVRPHPQGKEAAEQLQ